MGPAEGAEGGATPIAAANAPADKGECVGEGESVGPGVSVGVTEGDAPTRSVRVGLGVPVGVELGVTDPVGVAE